MTALTIKDRPASCEGRRETGYPLELPSLPPHCCGCEKSGCMWRNGCADFKRYMAALQRRYEGAADAAA